jgi:HK97 family phage portal protein
MSNGMKFSQMSSTNVDAQWLESRKYQVEEVCRVFGVMPIMVGYSDKAATYASAEQMFLAHVVYTLGPWHRRVEKSAAVSLLSEQERKDGHYFKFFTQALLRGAPKDRGEFYQTLYNVGALNPNEIRELEDRNPYDGGEIFRVQSSMVDPTKPEPVTNAPT